MPGSDDSASPRRPEAGAPSHWQQCLELLESKGGPSGAPHWNVARIGTFLREIEAGLVRAPQAVAGFFDKVACEGGSADGQFRQLVDAAPLLLADLANALAGRDVDGAHWSAGVREPEPSHPTLARGGPASPAPREPLDSVGVLSRITRAVRAKQYSMRTEQSYVDGCRRFLGFSAPRPVEPLGAADVQAFLEHLAVERKVVAST